jgi:hypothetical protein
MEEKKWVTVVKENEAEKSIGRCVFAQQGDV